MHVKKKIKKKKKKKDRSECFTRNAHESGVLWQRISPLKRKVKEKFFF